MRRFFSSVFSSSGFGIALTVGLATPLATPLAGQLPAAQAQSRTQSRTQPRIRSQAQSQTRSQSQAACPTSSDADQYDVIVFGDEVPGVMTALKVQQTLAKRNETARVALITEGDTNNGIGGHLVRGGLAYLDRNQVPQNLRSQYGIFGQPSPLYQQFLRFGQVDTIALDRTVAARNFERALDRADIQVIGSATLSDVQTEGSLVCSFTAGGQTYSAKQFIDASQSGELAAASGVGMMQGLEALGFPDSALSMGLMLDLYDVTIEQFKGMEAELIGRYFDPADSAAQRWLDVASGGNAQKRQDLLLSLLDYYRNPKLLYQGTADSADVRSLAFSILVHGYIGQEYDLKSSGFLFDRANIAVLDDRLSFNALLFYADSTTAQQLSRSGSIPTAQMMAIANEVKTLMQRVGVPRVEIMPELYIRNAGQIANPVDELSATLMAAGGVSSAEALGTFGYHLDDRGGIEGLDEEVEDSVLRLFDFEHMPVFNYGFRHTLPQEKENLAVLGPASGFGGLGTTAGRIVELNVSVGEGLAIAIAEAIEEDRSLHSITNEEVRRDLGHRPAVYGYRTDSYRAIATLERRFRGINYEQTYIERAEAWAEQENYAEAERELSRALTLNPQNADAYYLRGKIRAADGNLSLAQADLEKSIEIYRAEGNASYALNVQGTLEALLN
ncbi:MAG: FAD-dependent oxidoreductase [Cyanobacteria bacterium J06573_11]